MVDANGSYGRKYGRTDASPVLTYSDEVPLTLGTYVAYFKGEKDQTLYAYKLTGSSFDIKKLKQQMERASFKLPFVSCAATVSSVMKESGLFEDFKETVFPKGIKNYLDKFIKEDTHGNFTGKINNMTIELKAYNLGDEKKSNGEDYGDY